MFNIYRINRLPVHTYAEIVFPTAVRQSFTYSIPPDLQQVIKPGVRVWVPLQRRKAIGLVVHLHSKKPNFKTRAIEQVLDTTPVMDEELLKLSEWISRFYYCGWGEVIQAALPAGLNFYSEKYLKVSSMPVKIKLTKQENEIVSEIKKSKTYLLKEAKKRWSAGLIKSLEKKGVLEVWEEPELKVTPGTSTLWRWTDEAGEEHVSNVIAEYKDAGKFYKWVQALEALREFDLPEFQKNLTSHNLLDSSTLKRIAKEGLIRSEEVESNRINLKYEHEPNRLKTLNEEQSQAFGHIIRALKCNMFASFLLFGVTGSGKTEIYIHALQEALKQGKGGLVLVPEIGLTPQIVKRFYQIFGDDIAVIHSRLTMRDRYDAWRALQQGEKRIAIGVRSAVFAPVQNLGLIIVDEEHDASYKQEDPAPRYHARDVAIMRGSINDAVVVMGSATPGMVTLYGARKGKSKLLSLTRRPKGAKLPAVHVIDLKQYRSAMRGPLAIPLYQAIEQALGRGEQAILLYNRRGFASYLQCTDDGYIPYCPDCSVSLTYHKSKKQLRCHYCGYSEREQPVCPQCEKASLEPMGSGTQKLEDDIEILFPEARILRMDYDTTAGRDAHSNILSRFGRKEADILVGTQIVSKGLNFPDVTVVGVINADTELAFPSFRANERMYQLLSQVAGRSGRSDKEGRVYFQTWQPDHPALATAKNHDYRTFARRELTYRKMLSYPPYSRIIRFIFKGRREHRVHKVAELFTECLVETIGGSDVILGPTPAAIVRIQKYFRWETLVKVDSSYGARAIEHLIDQTFERYNHLKPDGASSVRINVNVDALE